MSVIALEQPRPCPVCEKEPFIEQCWTSGPWAVGCYGVDPTEHFVGVNGSSRLATIRRWNAEATEEHASDMTKEFC